MSAILFDLDGVIYESSTAIAGAADAIHWFCEQRIPHLFLTNTTSKSRSDLVKKLAGFDIPSQAKDFLTPPVAATQWLKKNNIKRISLFVPDSTREDFSGFELVSSENDIVDAVVVGDLGEQWCFGIMNTIFRTLLNNPQAKLIALGMTRYWRTGSGLQLDVGPMIKAFEYASDRHAIVTGKPAKEFFYAAVDLLDGASANDTIFMIGDDIRGDIEAAQQAGLKTILVRTGKFKASDLELGISPACILNSIAELPMWWLQNMDR